MNAIHRVLADLTVIVAIVGIGWSLFLLALRREAGPWFERFEALVVSMVIVTAVSGLTLLMAGLRPTEGLHLLYALIAVAIIPLARSFLGRTRGRARLAFIAVAFAVLGAVIYRLFTTG